MNYLKALGVLRLVSEDEQHGDPEARAYWDRDVFWLVSRFDEALLQNFFLNSYSPSPIIAPWGARSGFFKPEKGDPEKKARTAIEKIGKQSHERFRTFNQTVDDVRELLQKLGLSQKAKDEDKLVLLGECRSHLRDEVLGWLDACYVLTSDDRKFPPLFGTGGNEGSGSYVSGFAQQVVACLIEHRYDAALKTALFGDVQKNVASAQTPGHFSPQAAGGANAGQGMEGAVSTNPWDYLLAMEGACLWACGVVRKFGRAGRQVAAFPFTVNVTGAGAASLAASDSRKPKQAKREVAEMWLPIWERPLSVSELSTLLAEGRASVGTRMAETGLDFARAASGLGVDRGITAFSRIGFLMRNGQNFMGISLGRFDVCPRGNVDLLREIDPWLSRFRRACTDKSPPRFIAALRGIDRAIFDYCRYGDTTLFQAILIALGRAERELANGGSFRVNRDTNRTKVPPLRGLSLQWIFASNDNSTEFELALALAGIHDPEKKIGPIRANLEPVDWERHCRDWAVSALAVVWNSARIATNLRRVLARRLLDAERNNCERLPLVSLAGASVTAITRFVASEIDDEKLEALLWGLTSIEPGRWPDVRNQQQSADSLLPRAYALLKLLFLPFPLRTASAVINITHDPAILPLLSSNRVAEACRLAMRWLRAAGLEPLPHRVSGGRTRDDAWSGQDIGSLSGERIAAALLFPISTYDAQTLSHTILRQEQFEQPAA